MEEPQFYKVSALLFFITFLMSSSSSLEKISDDATIYSVNESVITFITKRNSY